MRSPPPAPRAGPGSSAQRASLPSRAPFGYMNMPSCKVAMGRAQARPRQFRASAGRPDMPLRVLCAGHGRRPQWPLAAAWAVSVASLLTVALLPRPAAHAYGTFLLAGRTGSLTVVLAYAQLLRRGTAPPRTVLLV